MTKEEESGERVMHVGVDLLCDMFQILKVGDRIYCDIGGASCYLFELVEVRFRFERPQMRHVLR